MDKHVSEAYLELTLFISLSESFEKTRPLWRHYFPSTEALVFVVDSYDRERIESARDEFLRLCNEEHLQYIPKMVFCNKQDLPGAMSPKEISEFFSAHKTVSLQKGAPTIFQGCSISDGFGVQEGFEQLAVLLADRSRAHPPKDSNNETETSSTSSIESELESRITTSLKPVNECLENFVPIKRSTKCPFAKAAQLWGVARPAAESSKSIEELALSHAKNLTNFTRRVALGERLDGFCIELDDPKARTMDVHEFGKVVRRMLKALSDADPAYECMMSVDYIHRKEWRFRFNRIDFFVTSFAPCYPKTSSRYAYDSDRAFILLQPEISFLRHNLPPDSPHTSWKHPSNIRDRTRVAFRKAGQKYFIPPTTRYPMAEHIVKPLKDDGNNKVLWWVSPEDQDYVNISPPCSESHRSTK